MKKKVTKTLAFVLALVMMLSVAGCGGGDSSTGEAYLKNREEMVFDKYIKDEEVVDLKGYEFKIVDFNTHVWAPEEVEDDKNQLSLDIIEDVERTFNCNITVEFVSADKIFDSARPAIMGGDKYADLIGTTRWAYGQLLAGDLLADLNEIEDMDLTQDFYYKELSELMTFDGKTYAFSADFDERNYTQFVMYYNKRIWNELGLPDAYQLVRDGKWTWDKCLEYANKALRDYDGNGIVDSESDRWGMAAPSGDLVNAMYASMEGTFFAKNQYGALKMVTTEAENAKKLDFIYDFFQKEKVLYKRDNEGYREIFEQGKSLFLSMINNPESGMRDMEDDWGILPMPKWNEAQENYANHVNHNSKIYAMTKTNKNTYEASIIIEALARRYQSYEDMSMDEYETISFRSEEDTEMLEKYILNQTYNEMFDNIRGVDTTFLKPYVVVTDAAIENKFSDINTEMLAIENLVDVALDEFLNNLQ